MGRFTGAFVAGCLLFLSAPIGMMIGAAMPWLDPETLGAFNFGHYAWVYLLVCVPTLFVTGAGLTVWPDKSDTTADAQTFACEFAM